MIASRPGSDSSGNGTRSAAANLASAATGSDEMPTTFTCDAASAAAASRKAPASAEQPGEPAWRKK